MNPQAFSDLFRRFVRHPALLGPVRQLLEREIYLFQCVINMKRPFHGAVWQWHQDFPTYYYDDEMPEPRLVNALVFIDEVREFNGPLMVIPASHNAPAYETAVDDMTTSYPLRAADKTVVARLADERGIEAPKGGPGSVIFAHTNLVHGSGPTCRPGRARSPRSPTTPSTTSTAARGAPAGWCAATSRPLNRSFRQSEDSRGGRALPGL